MADEKVNIVITAQDKTKGVLKAVGQSFTFAFGTLIADAIKGVINLIGDLARKLGETLTDSLNLAADFEEQIAILGIAARDATVPLDSLSDVALKIGSDTSLVGVSATEAADGLTGLYKAGLTTNDIFGDMQGYMAGTSELSGALRAAIDLQAASSMDLAGASDIVAIAMATFGLGAGEASGIADIFVKSADASVAEVEDLADGMRNFGPTAASYGLSLEETSTALAILSTRGIVGAEAGTSLKSMFTNLLRPTDKVRGLLDDLNISLYDQHGNMKPLVSIIGDLEGATRDLSQEQRDEYIQTLAGTYGMRALQTLIAEGIPGWDDMSTAIGDAATANEVAAARTDTHTGKMEALEGVVETVKIKLGDALLKGFTPLIETLSELIEEHGPEIFLVFEALGEKLGELAEDYLPELIEWIENIDWDEVVRAMEEDVIPAIDDVIEAFGSLITFVSDLSWFLSPQGTQDMQQELEDSLPDWLKPGSPTPLEIGIRGVTSAMQDMGAAAGTALPTAQNQYMNVYGGINMSGVQNQRGLLAELQGMMP